MLAQDPDQTPLKAPNADCAVTAGHQQHILSFYTHISTVYTADTCWACSPAGYLHIRNAEQSLLMPTELAMSAYQKCRTVTADAY